MSHVFNLYGVDKFGEPLSMFFANKVDMFDFIADVPGAYRCMKLQGVAYDDFSVTFNTRRNRKLANRVTVHPEFSLTDND